MEASGTGGFQLYVNSGGHLILDKQGVENDITQTATLATNVWTHIGISHATLGGSGNYILYINGVNTQSGAGAGGLFTTGLTYLFGDPNVSAFNGFLADFASWTNVRLTATEFSALANGARPNTIRPAAFTGWWPLDGLQSPEPDLSGNKNNGTLTGTLPAFGPPYMPFTSRWPQFIPTVVSPVVFRKSLSQLGGRVGSRQIQGWAQ